MRRSGIALIGLTTLVVGILSTGSGALAIDSGPLDATPQNANFGNVSANAPQTITETLTNNSATATTLTIASDQINGPDQADFTKSSDSCNNAVLNVGDTCSVDITFQPSSLGSENATLDIVDDDTTDGDTQSLSLTGTGVTQFAVSGGPLDFGDQRVNTTSGTQAVTVTNNTDYAANPANPNVTGGDAGDFNTLGCTGSVPGGNSGNTCQVTVTFTPGGTGTRNATLNVAGSSVGLTGNGVQPNAGLTPGTVNFGNQPLHIASPPSTLTLTNNGSSPLNYGSTDVSGATAQFSVGDNGCKNAGPITPGNSCTITVAFNPTVLGPLTATVNVHDDDPQTPIQHVNVSGKGTPSSVGFAPGTVTFVTPIPAGTASPVHVITVTNTTNANMPITGTSIVGANPQNFVRSADTCTGANLPADGTCSIRVKFTPSSAGLRTALLQVTDTGAVAPHAHQITLSGRATYPNDPKNIRGSVGCSASRIKWVSPTATRFATTVVVRNRTHSPANPGDGTIIAHTTGIARDKGLHHFTTYFYGVFAKYHSLTHAGKVNYSKGVRLKERTGEICTPQNGARLHDLTPTVTWLPSPTQNGYAFVLQRGSQTIEINYTKRTLWHIPSSWRFHSSTHRLAHGRSYTLYLYAYPGSHPNGIFIGKVSFSVL